MPAPSGSSQTVSWTKHLQVLPGKPGARRLAAERRRHRELERAERARDGVGSPGSQTWWGRVGGMGREWEGPGVSGRGHVGGVAAWAGARRVRLGGTHLLPPEGVGCGCSRDKVGGAPNRGLESCSLFLLSADLDYCLPVQRQRTVGQGHGPLSREQPLAGTTGYTPTPKIGPESSTGIEMLALHAADPVQSPEHSEEWAPNAEPGVISKHHWCGPHPPPSIRGPCRRGLDEAEHRPLCV